MFSPERLREDFSLLQQNPAPIYMDNACVTLKPRQVVAAMDAYYNEFSACGGRSIHKLGQRVTDEVEKARNSLKSFFSAKKPEQFCFTRNATESINLVTYGLDWKQGDTVLVTDKEHNSNLVPFLRLKAKGVRVVVIPSKEDNTFNMGAFREKLDGSVKLVAMHHTSNLDGVTTPIKDVIKRAHEKNIPVLVDAAQSAPHQPLHFKKLDADFVAISGHKMLGPSGIGALYYKEEWGEKLSPFITGGSTVVDTTYEEATFEKPPTKFEAGLQDYAGIIGYGAALDYLSRIIQDVQNHEISLNTHLTESVFADDVLSRKLTLIGPRDPKTRSGIFSFLVDGAHIHDLAIMLSTAKNIAIRTGAHCVHSWFHARNLKGSARASMYVYNTKAEVDVFLEELKKTLDVLS